MPGLIAHEWIEPRGGSENVLEAIAALYPDAHIITPWNNAPHRFPNRDVHELWLSRSAFRGKKAAAVPALLSAWRSAVPKDANYEWIIASSHLFAHHIRGRGLSKEIPKLIYAYTPARYIWTPELDARGEGMLAKVASMVLRPIDKRRAREATAIASISEFVRERIKASWGVDSTVIYPPVETTRLQSVPDWRTELSGDELAILERLPSTFILGASRFIPYKRLDLVIEAGEYADIPVVLAGAGPQRRQLVELQRTSRVPVHIIDDPSSALLYALYQRACVFVFPPVEDFGIMPVEAMALGTPVVGSGIGGSSETITEGVSGTHFEASTPEHVGRAVLQAIDLPADGCRTASLAFSRESFDSAFRQWMDDSLARAADQGSPGDTVH